jgi:hypothetical protein
VGGQGSQRVVWLFRTVLGRTPRPEEVERVLGFVASGTGLSAAKEELPAPAPGDGRSVAVEDTAEARWADVCQMLFASVEHRLIR